MAQRDNGSKLTTREVTIQTVDITIQAMRIGPKQVTLALFRQLIRDDDFDTGIPWGWVHYHWDGCGMMWQTWNRGEAMHVVWQDGDNLRRAVVHQDRHYDTRYHAQVAGSPLWEWACRLPQLYIAV
jgi:hypothetical protein